MANKSVYKDEEIINRLNNIESMMQQIMKMVTSLEKTGHHHIICIEDICGGEPIIKGTRMPVRSIIKYLKIGETVESILEDFPQLNASQIYDCLSYYYEHQSEIDKYIEINEKEACLEGSNKIISR